MGVIKLPNHLPRIEELESDTEDEESPLHQVPEEAPKNEEPLADERIPVPMAPKRKQNPKNDEYWDGMVGRRSSTHERKPTAKIQAVPMDPDHPTDEQARNSPLAAE